MKKTDLKLLAIVAGGVLLAGAIMGQLSDVPGVSHARDGFS